jgi:hypothetical protein
MERIVIFQTDDGNEVAIQVADHGPLGPEDGPLGPDGASLAGAGDGHDLPGPPQGPIFRGIPDGALTTRGLGGGRLVERTQQSLDEVLAHAQPAVTALLRQVREQEEPPDELEVEFGIQVSLEVGAYIAAAGSQANFRVTMRWLKHGG